MIDAVNTIVIPDAQEEGGFNSGLFALVIIIAILFCIAGVGLVFFLQRRNKKKLEDEDKESKNNQERASVYRAAGGETELNEKANKNKDQDAGQIKTDDKKNEIVDITLDEDKKE